MVSVRVCRSVTRLRVWCGCYRSRPAVRPTPRLLLAQIGNGGLPRTRMGFSMPQSAEAQRIRRVKAVAAGRCVRCPRSARPGRTLCERCVGYAARYNRLCSTGWTEDRYQRALAEQGGLCAICGTREVLVCDHDHDSKSPRALLCTLCNTRLGWFERYCCDVFDYLCKYDSGGVGK